MKKNLVIKIISFLVSTLVLAGFALCAVLTAHAWFHVRYAGIFLGLLLSLPLVIITSKIEDKKVKESGLSFAESRSLRLLFRKRVFNHLFITFLLFQNILFASLIGFVIIHASLSVFGVFAFPFFIMISLFACVDYLYFDYMNENHQWASFIVRFAQRYKFLRKIIQ